jgi:hypothetical protein
MDFTHFKISVARQFERMSKHPLFRVDIDKDLLWLTYLNAFPPGTNLTYRQRREYDCSCCRQFVRAVGDVVAIIDDRIVSIWDIDCDEPAYKMVANTLSNLVKPYPIDNVFLTTERQVGTDKTFEQQIDSVVSWNHFFVNIPSQFRCPRSADIGPRLSETRALHDVLYRSLEEITDDAVDTVLDLIGQNSLYRGAEHKHTLETFRQLKNSYPHPDRKHVQRGYPNLGVEQAKHAFVWACIGTLPPSVSRIRNTAIGTLLVDLSEGMEMDAAVRRFESVVAPANYKRPTALVTPKMVEAAKQKLTDLGLLSALERRYARLEDLSVNDILFADRSSRRVIEPDVFQALSAQSPAKRHKYAKVDTVPVETFIREILPRAESVEVLFENRHAGNLVSLIAPVDPTANRLFKWNNHFSWSYQGDLADSIKERVKQAGGSVTGDLCCRLAWYNHDDLDLHMIEPSGYHIYYPNKGRRSLCGGMLDVDMNAGCGTTRTPVENIFYPIRSTMLPGVYELSVHQFNKRESKDVGFDVELDWLGTIHRFSHPRAVRDGGAVMVVKFLYSAGGIEIIESLPSSQTSRTVWGLKTQEFQRVNVVMRSPNCWGERPTGNEHYFFMLAGCINEGQARGFYNEFLKEELTPHRKVIEMVGAKMRTAESADQLSGLGFSITQPTDVLVRVKGAFTRTINVTI